MAKVTIGEISRRTGLSRGTVSRAINDRADISQATKERVLDVCREMNFVPDRAARSLATGRCFSIAAIVDEIGSTFVSDFLRGAIRRARLGGYSVGLVDLSGEPEVRDASLKNLANERIDGILLGASAATAELSKLLNGFTGLNVVAAQPQDAVECDVLAPDEVESGRLAGRLAAQVDAKDLLYLDSRESPSGESRYRGFSEACAERGIDADEVTVQVGIDSADFSDRLSELKPRLKSVRCIAAANDYLAMQTMSMCLWLGRIPGRDVAVIGQGNDRASSRIAPELTSTDLNGDEIGRRSVEILLQRLNNTRMDAHQSISVAPRLLRRASSLCLVP